MKKIIFDPGLDEKIKSGYYFADASCSNCSDPNEMGWDTYVDVMIPEGMLKPKEKFICPNCKCKTLEIL